MTKVKDRHLVGGAAAACAVCCAAPIIGFLGVAGFAATAVTFAFAGAAFALVVAAATVIGLVVRRRRAKASGDTCLTSSEADGASTDLGMPSVPEGARSVGRG